MTRALTSADLSAVRSLCATTPNLYTLDCRLSDDGTRIEVECAPLTSDPQTTIDNLYDRMLSRGTPTYGVVWSALPGQAHEALVFMAAGR